jgi:hypothetical protein
MVEEEVSEAKLAANGIIIIYFLFTIAAVWTQALGIWLGVLAILIMTVLTNGIAPAYPEVILLFNYALFALLIAVVLLGLAGVQAVPFILTLVVIAGPLLVIGVPAGHILYLIRQERMELRKAPKEVPAPPPTEAVPPKEVPTPQPPTKEPSPKIQPTPQEKVKGKIGRGFALICGYETLKARHAIGLLIVRTAITWIIGSSILMVIWQIIG